MQCLVCEKELKYCDWAAERLTDFHTTTSYPDNFGAIEIYCCYGSRHDQCDTAPFEAAICDDCIEAKKHLFKTDEQKKNEIWLRCKEESERLLSKMDCKAALKAAQDEVEAEEFLEKAGVDVDMYYAIKDGRVKELLEYRQILAEKPDDLK